MAKQIDLRRQYRDDIESWDWEGLKADCLSYVDVDDDGERVGRTFIGTVFALMPSGKYYMPWTTNQTWRDVIMDQEFMEILEEVANQHECWIESGEGDPCDLFVARMVEGD